MSYALQRSESVVGGIRRIIVEEARSAIDKIDDSELSRDDAVHEVRKHGKKIRAALRLVRPVLDGYGEKNREIRDIGRLLSASRDARVLHDTHLHLLDEVGWAKDEPGARRLGQALESEAAADASHLDRALAEAHQRLVVVVGDAPGWELSAEGIESVSPGLRKTYKRARKAGRRCRGNPTDEQLHEWRKRVKDHWYHSRLLANAWPRVLKAREVAAHHLAGLLGDDHDLAVYRQSLQSIPDVPAKIGKKLHDQIALQRRLLQQESHPVAARLFAEKPRHFAVRMEKYWEAWRQPGLQRIP